MNSVLSRRSRHVGMFNVTTVQGFGFCGGCTGRAGHRNERRAASASALLQQRGLRGIHAPVLGAPFVHTGATKAVRAKHMLQRHACFDLPQKANDLFFPVRDVASSARAVSAVHRCVEPHDTPADKIWFVESLNFLIAPTLFASYAYRL